jgi:adenylate cyclase
MDTFYQRSGIRVPLTAKLIILVVMIITFTSIIVINRAYKLFTEHAIEQKTAELKENAQQIANELNEKFKILIDKSRFVAHSLVDNKQNKINQDSILKSIFFADTELVSIEVYANKSFKRLAHVANEKNLKSYKLTSGYIETLHQQKPFSGLGYAFSGETEISNSSYEDGAPLITIATPLDASEASITKALIIDIRLESFEKLFSQKNEQEKVSFLISKSGVVLAHPNEYFTLHQKHFTEDLLVQEAISKKQPHGAKTFLATDNTEWLGSYSKTLAGPIVLTQVSLKNVFQKASDMRAKSFTTLFFAILISISLVGFLARSIIRPLVELKEAASEIAKGNLNVRVAIASNDEIGDVTIAFDEMINGLKDLETKRH